MLHGLSRYLKGRTVQLSSAGDDNRRHGHSMETLRPSSTSVDIGGSLLLLLLFEETHMHQLPLLRQDVLHRLGSLGVEDVSKGLRGLGEGEEVCPRRLERLLDRSGALSTVFRELAVPAPVAFCVRLYSLGTHEFLQEVPLEGRVSP